jgi:hypothetical protein
MLCATYVHDCTMRCVCIRCALHARTQVANDKLTDVSEFNAGQLTDDYWGKVRVRVRLCVVITRVRAGGRRRCERSQDSRVKDSWVRVMLRRCLRQHVASHVARHTVPRRRYSPTPPTTTTARRGARRSSWLSRLTWMLMILSGALECGVRAPSYVVVSLRAH